MNKLNQFSWVGNQAHYVDQIDVRTIEQLYIGRFGGNSTSGQYKNEDACLVWVDTEGDWEFAIVLDAHQSSESADAVINLLTQHESILVSLLSREFSPLYFSDFEQTIINLFQSDAFLKKCKSLNGETACLMVVRREKYLWWFSVGDCVCFLFHEDLAALNQYQLNQRQFYEWVGRVNTFNQFIPTYSSGIRELRAGTSRILLVTDGILECPGEPYIHSEQLSKALTGDIEVALTKMLSTIQQHGVRDSTTLIAWECSHTHSVAWASDQ